MTSLPIEDTHHLKAAKGWVELANHLEAFDNIEPLIRYRGGLRQFAINVTEEALANLPKLPD